MAQGIKNRIFGSDVPVILKKKIEARQLLAKKDRSPTSEIKPSKYPDERSAYYTYDELQNQNFDGVADLSSRTPMARMWTAVSLRTNTAKEPVHYEEKHQDDSLKNHL